MCNDVIKPINHDNVCFCVIVNDNFAKHIGVALTSLVMVANRNFFYDVIILYRDLSSENKKKILSIFKHKKNFSARLYDAKEYLFKIDNIDNQKFLTRCLKFGIFDLLKSYDKVLYFDGDAIFIKDPSNLLNIDLKDNYVAAVTDYGFYTDLICGEEKEFWSNWFKKFNLSSYFNFFNSGFMVINMRKNVEDFVISKISSLSTIFSTKCFVDQGIFNYLYRNRVLYLDYPWNVLTNFVNIDKLSPKEKQIVLNGRSSPYFVHYSRLSMPLYVPNTLKVDYYWKCVKKSPYKKVILNEKKQIKKSTKKAKKLNIKTLIRHLFPRTSKIGIFLRKIYYKIKNKLSRH